MFWTYTIKLLILLKYGGHLGIPLDEKETSTGNLVWCCFDECVYRNGCDAELVNGVAAVTVVIDETMWLWL